MERGQIVLYLISAIIATCPMINAATCSGGKADVVFIMDTSDSMGFSNYQMAREFVKNISYALDVAQDKTRVGAIKFASTAEVKFHLNQYSTREAVRDAIGVINTVSGGTYTHLALVLLRNATAAENGGRGGQGIPQMGIVITDGQSIDALMSVNEAKKAKDAGIQLMAVGIGNNVNTKELQDISSNSQTDFFQVSDFSKLSELEDNVISRVCAVAKGSFSKGVSIQTNSSILIGALYLLLVMRQWLEG